MAGKTIDMSKLRKVIKLYVGGKNKVLLVPTWVYLAIRSRSTLSNLMV